MFQRGITAATRASRRRRPTGVAPSATRSTGVARRDHGRDATAVPRRAHSGGSPFAVNPSTPLDSSAAGAASSPAPPRGLQIRTFQSVGRYHDVADDTLHSIQDAVEAYLEARHDATGAAEDDEDDAPEVNYADGVLTLSLPPHGTWVINKQTPNRQLWWSSPLSGPRRYGYDEGRGRWVYSRGGASDGDAGAGTDAGERDTLGAILNEELEELFGESLGTDDSFCC